MNKDELEYRVYLLRKLTCDIEDMIDSPPVSFEEWRQEKYKEK